MISYLCIDLKYLGKHNCRLFSVGFTIIIIIFPCGFLF